MEKCSCKYYPTVIVPGIGQSKVDLYSRDGKRLNCAWPLDIDEKALVKDIAADAVLMAVTKKEDKFLAALKASLKKAIAPLSVSREGFPKYNLKPVDYDCLPVSECAPDDKRYIYKMVPLESLSEQIGEDHVFFFSYNSFGQPYETAKKLNDYIENVKKLTGHDKVNIVPVSLGGSIATAYFDAYGYKNDINRVCYFVPAANGSTLIYDVFSNNLDLSDPESLFSMLLGDGTAKKLCSFKKYLPKDGLIHIANALIDTVKEEILLNCPGMWAVLPNEKYTELRDKLLIGSKYGTLRAKTDRFYRAQSNLRNILIENEQRGVKFFSICGYDNSLLPFAGTKKLNSDTIVDFKSASLYGTAAPAGEALPKDYQPVFDRCKNTDHNHISPENTVDLGTAIFPDSTFCFRYQIHDYTAYNDVALSLCKEILTNESFTDVYSDERFPQFNGSRNIYKIKYKLLPRAYDLLHFDLHERVEKELKEAIEEAENIFKNTIIKDSTAADNATSRLDAAVLAATPDYRK